MRVEIKKLILRQEALEETMKRTRAYVGYYKAPIKRGREERPRAQDPLAAFYATTIEAQNAAEAARAQIEGVGGEADEEDDSSINFEDEDNK